MGIKRNKGSTTSCKSSTQSQELPQHNLVKLALANQHVVSSGSLSTSSNLTPKSKSSKSKSKLKAVKSTKRAQQVSESDSLHSESDIEIAFNAQASPITISSVLLSSSDSTSIKDDATPQPDLPVVFYAQPSNASEQPYGGRALPFASSSSAMPGHAYSGQELSFASSSSAMPRHAYSGQELSFASSSSAMPGHAYSGQELSFASSSSAMPGHAYSGQELSFASYLSPMPGHFYSGQGLSFASAPSTMPGHAHGERALPAPPSNQRLEQYYGKQAQELAVSLNCLLENKRTTLSYRRSERPHAQYYLGVAQQLDSEAAAIPKQERIALHYHKLARKLAAAHYFLLVESVIITRAQMITTLIFELLTMMQRKQRTIPLYRSFPLDDYELQKKQCAAAVSKLAGNDVQIQAYLWQAQSLTAMICGLLGQQFPVLQARMPMQLPVPYPINPPPTRVSNYSNNTHLPRFSIFANGNTSNTADSSSNTTAVSGVNVTNIQKSNDDLVEDIIHIMFPSVPHKYNM